MSVAGPLMPFVPVMFKGDADQLLDALISCCNEVKASAMLKPLVRNTFDLVPYDFGDSPNPIKPQRAAAAPKPQQPAAAPKPQPPASPAAPAKPAANRSGSPTSKSETGGPASRTPKSRGSLDASSTATPASPAVTFRSVASRAEIEALLQMSPPESLAACPGFFNSPRPEVLPMPTSTLLLRAAVKA